MRAVMPAVVTIETGSATGLIGKRRYSPPTAAMANGAAAHALDFDDHHQLLLACFEIEFGIGQRRFVAGDGCLQFFDPRG